MQHSRAVFFPIITVFALALGAQTIPDTLPAQIAENAAAKSIKIAEDQVQRIGTLVDAGALPRMRLEQAQRDLADARDAVVLDRTLYGRIPIQSLTEEMAADMVAAAQRRVGRQQARIADATKMVDDGIMARNSVTTLQDELSFRNTSLSLARTRANLIAELTAMARAERDMERTALTIAPGVFVGGMQHYEGSGVFDEAKELKPIELAFAERFDKPLPISADGDTEVHRALGFDHRGRVDVAVNPELKEGQWLMSYLKTRKIPFYAFTHAIPGKATGAHIHIGPGSTRLLNAD
jgi:hypothetical protein